VVGVGIPVRIHGMNWGVIVEQDAGEINEASAEITGRLVVFLLGNIAIIAILVWLGRY